MIDLLLRLAVHHQRGRIAKGKARAVIEGLERHPAVVKQDLPEVYAFIARDDQAAAERVLEAVETGFLQLTRHPESGVAFPTRNPRLK
ncbi:MAG: type II toxin-antitoxin system RelE/ParE family toxin [Chthoniobacterales bacterium]|nr:type II toxin-antitoxin system RelE/ParE family toxin [Chthoniobacterales bacterium]